MNDGQIIITKRDKGGRIIASSPGHSQFFNVIYAEKRESLVYLIAHYSRTHILTIA